MEKPLDDEPPPKPKK
jgi:hypothetical protein